MYILKYWRDNSVYLKCWRNNLRQNIRERTFSIGLKIVVRMNPFYIESKGVNMKRSCHDEGSEAQRINHVIIKINSEGQYILQGTGWYWVRSGRVEYFSSLFSWEWQV